MIPPAGADRWTVQSACPNATLAQDLRNVAVWLDNHPELPRLSPVAITMPISRTPETAREQLAVITDALGARADQYTTTDYLTVRGTFGAVRISAVADASVLSADPAGRTDQDTTSTEEAA